MGGFLALLFVLLLGYLYGAIALGQRRAHRLRRLSFSEAVPEALRFPPGFHFGAATSAHQVEGGTTNNNWTQWEGVTRPDGRPGIFTGEHAGRAADHWECFAQDLERMQALGLTMYRFSLEWSRLEPTEGRFDDNAMRRYRSWCEQLRAAGITPMVTLHHFTEPRWIADRGGFEDPATIDAFVRFVEYVVPHLADVVDYWITINEPAVYTTLGWLRGEFPPGKTDPARAAKVLEHLLRAHGQAYHRLHALDATDADADGQACQVSIAKNITPFLPRHWWNLLDVASARAFHRFFNAASLDALATGHYRVRLPGLGRYTAELPDVKGTWDFLGVNHYFRFLTRFAPLAKERAVPGFHPAREKSDMGWDLTPQSLYDALRMAAGYKQPLIVTEHGIADGAVPDRRRQWFLAQSLYALEQARADGVDVRGYLHWSLLDNFEWTHGYGPRFGLYRVDFETQARTLTGGGALYRNVVRAHRGRGERDAD